MSSPRVPLYDRLPEIYRIRDEEQEPRGHLRHYLALVEEAFGEIHRNIEALYHDLFTDSCDDWVIPYIGDLLGVSHLSGEAWTLRADVADTIALRRRKGTLASIGRLTASGPSSSSNNPCGFARGKLRQLRTCWFAWRDYL